MKPQHTLVAATVQTESAVKRPSSCIKTTLWQKLSAISEKSVEFKEHARIQGSATEHCRIKPVQNFYDTREE